MTERGEIEDAFRAWENANTNSGVHFVFTTGSSRPTGAEANNTFYIDRMDMQTPGATSISNTGNPTSEGNITTSAATSIHSSITSSAAIFNVMLHEIGHTFGLAHCVECAQGSSIMTAFAVDCLCPSFPCDQNTPFNGTRFGCPPLSGPRSCDEDAVNDYANYPQTTPTPTSTPTPCAQNGSTCYWDTDCCNYKCGEQTGTCIPCESNPQELGQGCMSEGCYRCYNFYGGTYCTGLAEDCWTPLIVDVAGDGLMLTNADNGVNFNNGFGTILRTAWTTFGDDDAWLVVDRNGNVAIDDASELFGNAASQPAVSGGELRNGFRALREFDKPVNGGNGDGVINASDSIFGSLLLWQDLNHNGISELLELHSLPQLGLSAIDLDYKPSKRKDRNNNSFSYRAKVTDVHGSQMGRWLYDVFLDARRAQ